MEHGRRLDQRPQEAPDQESARSAVAGTMASLAPGPLAAAGNPNAADLPARARLRDLIGVGGGETPLARMPSRVKVRDLLAADRAKVPGPEDGAR